MNNIKENDLLSIFLFPFIAIFKLSIWIFNNILLILACLNLIFTYFCGYQVYLILKEENILDFKLCFIALICFGFSILYLFLYYFQKIEKNLNLIYEELRYINDKDDNDRDKLKKKEEVKEEKKI